MPRNSERSVPRLRIENLSDLVFGLALSIGALVLIGKPPTTPADIQSDILGFGFSFLILISVWLRYTRIMSVLPAETGFTVLLNTVLLFLVCIEPYLFSLLTLGNGAFSDYESVLYALDLGGLMAILSLFTHMLTIEEKRLIARSQLSRQKAIRTALALSALVLLISILPQFWSWRLGNTPLRILLWYLVLPIVWSARLVRSPNSSKRF